MYSHSVKWPQKVVQKWEENTCISAPPFETPSLKVFCPKFDGSELLVVFDTAADGWDGSNWMTHRLTHIMFCLEPQWLATSRFDGPK